MANIYDSRMSSVMAAALSANRGRIMGDNQAMMGLYMDKLKDMLPNCPMNQQVSKLQVIQHVIDYIGDLQDVLTSDYSDSDSDSESPQPNSPVSYNYSQQDMYAPNLYQDTYGENHKDNSSSHNYYSNCNEAGIIESETMYRNNTYNTYNTQYNQINYHGSMGNSNDLNLCSMMDSSCNISYGYSSSGYSSDDSSSSM